MAREQYFFIITICAAIFGALFLLYPFLKYLFFAVLLTYLLHPLKRALQKRIRIRTLLSVLLISLILVVVILPTIFISSELLKEIRSTLSVLSDSRYRSVYLEKAEELITRITGEPTDLHLYKDRLFSQMRAFLMEAAPDFLGSLTELLLGLFIMFFVLFYSFQENPLDVERVTALIPLAPSLKAKLLDEVKSVTWAVVYGQVMTALVQGVLGGLGFFLFGVPNPFLWGFIMIILSFLPLVGTPIIWAPAGIFLIVSGETFRGIGLLIWGGVLVMNIDNFLKPRLIAGRSNIHPVVVLLGVLGGLKLFGFIGLVAGPLILALLIALIRFYEEEYLKIKVQA